MRGREGIGNIEIGGNREPKNRKGGKLPADCGIYRANKIEYVAVNALRVDCGFLCIYGEFERANLRGRTDAEYSGSSVFDGVLWNN